MTGRQGSLLIFTPTYNERENVELIYQEIKKLNLNADMLFLDDNSPDGTGAALEALSREDSRVHVIHRPGKQGIGSAHREGIRWAYQRGYRMLVTMDCDFSHQPGEIPRFLNEALGADIIVGSRYMEPESISDWNLFRKILTRTGHFLTKYCLKMPYDASGAFRSYRLDRIPEGVFDRVISTGYSFFFESLHVLSLNKFKICEVPIRMPKRAYGHSKMKLADMVQSLRRLWTTWRMTSFQQHQYLYAAPLAPAGGASIKTKDEVAWDEYWSKKENKSKMLYDLIAVFYRIVIIRPLLNEFIRREFKSGAKVLHAGCGSGQVDTDIAQWVRITALDISAHALEHYRRINGDRSELMRGSIFDIPSSEGVFDGIYNLGVMEHFTEEQIAQILSEFKRVLKPEGKLVLFWPPEYGLTVRFMKGVHFILNRVMKKNLILQPDEITRLLSKKHAERILGAAGFTVDRHYFGIKDFFTYSVVVCRIAPK